MSCRLHAGLSGKRCQEACHVAVEVVFLAGRPRSGGQFCDMPCRVPDSIQCPAGTPGLALIMACHFVWRSRICIECCSEKTGHALLFVACHVMLFRTFSIY